MPSATSRPWMRAFSLVATGLLLFGVSACGAQPAAPAASKQSATSASVPPARSAPGPAKTAAPPLQAVRIGVTSPTPGFLYVYVARDLGFFRAHGLAVKIVRLSGAAMAPALVSGQIQFTATAPTAVQGAVKGLPVRVVVVTANKSHELLIGAKGITSVKQLAGKVFAGAGQATDVSAEQLMARAGLPMGSYRTVIGSSDQVRAAMLQHGEAQVTFVGLEAALPLLDEGYKLLSNTVPGDVAGIGTGVAEINNHPGLVRSVVAAVVQATGVMTTDRARIVPLLQRDFHLSAADASRAFGLLKPTWTPSGRVSDAQLQHAIKLAVDALKSPPSKPIPVSQVFNLSFVPTTGAQKP